MTTQTASVDGAPTPTFTGPKRRVVCVANADQVTRYASVDPRPFLRAAERSWGPQLEFEVIDERGHHLEESLAQAIEHADCLVLLSGAVHREEIEGALCKMRQHLGAWIARGGGFVALHPGDTMGGPWLPEGVDATFLRQRVDHLQLDFIAGSPVSDPFGVEHVRDPRTPLGEYNAAYFVVQPERAAATSGIWSPHGPVLVASQVGSGRVVVSPLIVDWHGYVELFVNILCWATAVRTIRAGGIARALSALSATAAADFGVLESTEPPADGATGSAVDIEWPPQTVVLPSELALQPMPVDPSTIGVPLLRAALSGGRWQNSNSQTVEICRYLTQAGAIDRFPDVIDRLSKDYAPQKETTAFAAAQSLVLCHSDTGSRVLAGRADETATRLTQIVSRIGGEGLVADFGRLVLAAHRSGSESVLSAVLARGAEEVDALMSAGRSADGARNPIFDLYRFASLRALFHFRPDTEADLSRVRMPVVRELLGERPPAAQIMDFLEICMLGAPQDEQQTFYVEQADFDALLLYVHGDLVAAGRIQPVTLARHLAFWHEHAGLHRRAHLLSAAGGLFARGVRGADLGRATPAMAATERQVRERLDEAYRLLAIPPAGRRSERALDESLADSPLDGPLRLLVKEERWREALSRRAADGAGVASIRLAWLALIEWLGSLRPLVVAIAAALIAGGLGVLAPFVSNDFLHVLVSISSGARAAVLVLLLAVTVVLARSATPRIGAGEVIAAAVVFMVASTAAVFLACAIFATDVGRWRGGPPLVHGAFFDRVWHTLPAAGTLGALELVAAVAFIRRARSS